MTDGFAVKLNKNSLECVQDFKHFNLRNFVLTNLRESWKLFAFASNKLVLQAKNFSWLDSNEFFFSISIGYLYLLFALQLHHLLIVMSFFPFVFYSAVSHGPESAVIFIVFFVLFAFVQFNTQLEQQVASFSTFDFSSFFLNTTKIDGSKHQ